MQARIEINLEPLVRAVLVSILASTLASLAFTLGWLGGQAYRVSLPKAIVELEQRLAHSLEGVKKLPLIGKVIESLTKGEQDWMGFKLFAYELPKKPKDPKKILEALQKLKSLAPTPSPVPSVTPSIVASVEPVISPVDRLKSILKLALEKGEYGPRPERLLKTDLKKIQDEVQRYKEIGPGEVLEVFARVWSLPYVADGLRRDISLKALGTQEIRELFGLEELQVLRIVKGWDLQDIQEAHEKDGLDGIRALAEGRPPAFFFELDAASKGVRTCRLHLMKVRTSREQGLLIPQELEKILKSATCPDGGTYEETLDRGDTCSHHGTLIVPRPGFVHFVLYVEPVEEAMRQLDRDESALAIDGLLESMRLYPQHALAAYGLAEAYHRLKDYESLVAHLEGWQKSLGRELRMGFLMALGHYALGQKPLVASTGARALQAPFGAPPARLTTLKDFYLQQDRVREVVQSCADGLLHIDFNFKPEAQCASQKCLANLEGVANQILGFIRGYPGNHPLLGRIDRAIEKLSRMQKGASVAKRKAILLKVRELNKKKQIVMGDTTGKYLWKAMASKISDGFFEPCPRTGRYLLLDGNRLECTEHRGLFERKVDYGERTEPESGELRTLAAAILKAALAGDRSQSKCYDLQQEYMKSHDVASIGVTDSLGKVQLASGESMECPRRGAYSIVQEGDKTMITCSEHGAVSSYFDLDMEVP